jgi:DNA-binding response OmpR family regulator
MINVLCVDDEEHFLILAKEFLEASSDLHVDIANSVTKAETALSRSHYDAIISDYKMPLTDGLEFLKRVRDRDKEMPFILLTGHGREEIVVEAFNSGVSSYVQKGNDLEAQFLEVEHKVKQAVAKHVAELELFIKVQQARIAMDMARIASWEVDGETNLFKFDDIFYELYGTDATKEGGYFISPETYINKFIHPEDRDRVAEWIGKGPQVIGPEGFGQIDHRIIRADGEVRQVRTRVGFLFGAYGRLVRVYGVNMDITDLKA